MDSLILTFNKEQMSLYKELLTKENIELNFDASLQKMDEITVSDFDEVISKIKECATTLVNLNKQSSSFFAFLTQQEIKAIVPIYYNAIREIRRHSNIIGGDSWKLSFKMAKINRVCLDITQRYANFLPYKAALHNKEDYHLEIERIDKQFKKSIELANIYKEETLLLFEKACKTVDIVNEFVKRSSKASDEPKFKKFDCYDFFWSVDAFIEQLNAIQK